MKKVLLLAFIAVLGGHIAKAQCTSCTPVNCAAQKPTGGLCNSLPDDTAGQPYDAVISFYMPHNLSDPMTLSQCGGCSSVTLRQIDIVGIQGLPPGLSYTEGNNGSYNVANGDTTGCVHFCGTPIAPGTYYVTVNLLADVTAHGTPIGDVNADDQAQSYRDTMIIYPGVSACPGTFDLGNGCLTKACDSVPVNLNATLTNTDCPSLISYSWDLGNGNTSNSKTPGAINYNVPDTFPLTLTTTFYTYRVKQVNVNVTGGYCGDVEETTCNSFPFFPKPDPYIRINSLAFNNRGSSSDVLNTTFTNLNLVIPGGNCADQLEIQVWDEDTGNPLGSQDDDLDHLLVTPAVPGPVGAVGSNASVIVTFDTVATSSVSESIDIIVFPHPPLPVLSIGNDSICGGDSTLITISPQLTGYLYNWYLNDTTELLTYDSAIYAKQAGSYTVKITNMETGCTEFSAPAVLAVGQAAPGNVNVIFNGTQLYVTPFPATGFAVEWYLNGNLIPGQTGKFLTPPTSGVYSAIVYNVNFPDCRRQSGTDTLTLSGIEEAVYNPIYDLSIYPNPNSGKFTVKFSTETVEDITLSATNLVGQKVFEQRYEGFSGNFNQDLDVSSLPKGVYVINIETPRSRTNKMVVVQ